MSDSPSKFAKYPSANILMYSRGERAVDRKGNRYIWERKEIDRTTK